MSASSVRMLFAISVLAGCAAAVAAPEAIPVRLETEDVWVEFPPCPEEPGPTAQGISHSAAWFTHYLNPETGTPYEAEPGNWDPAMVCRQFRLEKQEFLLGEPILVEYRVSMDGPGSYDERAGGNYRLRGRNDSFLFLLRREDGSWVRDIHPSRGGPGGGLSTFLQVREGEAHSTWNAVQRWCAIEEPGRYELYCFYAPTRTMWQEFGRQAAIRAQIPEHVLRTHTVGEFGLRKTDTDLSSDEFVIEFVHMPSERAPSPLIARMPPEVISLLEEFVIPTPSENVRMYTWREVKNAIQNAALFARFPITIRAGSLDEEQAMRDFWIARGEEALRDMESRESRAVLDAIFFALQPHFLGAIREWVAASDLPARHGLTSGLSRNPHVEATEIFLKLGLGDGRGNWGPNPADNVKVMEHFIELLTHEEAVIRESALKRLRTFSGNDFLTHPDGSPLQELGDDQWAEAQALWREWWEQHKDTFGPAS